MYLLKLNMLWWTLGGAIFVPRALFGANLNMDDIRALDLLVSNQEILYVSIYKLKVNVNYVTSRMGPFWRHNYNLSKLGRVPLGDVTYQISKLWGILFSGKNIFNVFSK